MYSSTHVPQLTKTQLRRKRRFEAAQRKRIANIVDEVYSEMANMSSEQWEACEEAYDAYCGMSPEQRKAYNAGCLMTTTLL